MSTSRRKTMVAASALRRCQPILAALAMLSLGPSLIAASVVINEVNFQPPEKRPLEFIELYNSGSESVALSGWTLNDYRFETNALISAHGYLVLAVNPVAFQIEFGFKPFGPFPGKLRHTGPSLRLQDASGALVEEVQAAVGFPWPTAAGGGGSSMERINPSLPASSPAAWASSGFGSNSLRASPRPRQDQNVPTEPPAWCRPTPGKLNSVFVEAPPPGFLSVEHHPLQPKSGESVTIQVQLADPRQVTNVALQLQIVEPGKYIRFSDPAYRTNWLNIPMQPENERPGWFTLTLPGEFQKHRRLIRYRVNAAGLGGGSVSVPHPDDEAPNFAWLVYDRLPPWTGASQPGKTPALAFSTEMLGTLPAYHLLARAEDVAHSQWDPTYGRRLFFGTLVYEGRVYDHIQFHNRGQASTYLAGKNKWGFKFNRGHPLAARDNYDRLYQHPWTSLDLNACASPWVQMNRGMAGMDEALSFRSYQLAGIPAANTHWLQFRVIDRADEDNSRNQYQSDLWGLYLAVQSMSGAWLEELGLPSGNVYSLQSGRKHLAAGMPANGSDWNEFWGAIQQNQTEAWWRAHFDLPAFYSFHALNRLLGNVDLREDANHGFYHAPDGRWAPIPWDNDMMFIPHSHQSGVIYPVRCLEIPALNLEFKNRAREILDLFVSDTSTNGGQFAQLVAEYDRILCPPGQSRTWPELDMAMWNYHPRSGTPGEFYVNPYTRGWSGLPFRRVLDTPDFGGFCRYIVKFCSDSRPRKNYAPDDNNPVGHGWGYLAWEARDEDIPQRPEVRYHGSEGFPATNLSFAITPFAPAGKPDGKAVAFGAVEWRVAEIRAPGLAGYQPGVPCAYELTARWQSGQLRKAEPVVRLLADTCAPNHTYRVRARYRDTTGRWSHWSEPVQVVPK